jgi:hypothetical protein
MRFLNASILHTNIQTSQWQSAVGASLLLFCRSLYVFQAMVKQHSYDTYTVAEKGNAVCLGS